MTKMHDAAKCPSCADEGQQELMGFVSLNHQQMREPPPALYRCLACGYLYTVPALCDVPALRDNSAAELPHTATPPPTTEK